MPRNFDPEGNGEPAPPEAPPGRDPEEVQRRVEVEGMTWSLVPPALEEDAEYQAAQERDDEQALEALEEAHLDDVLAEQPRIVAVR